jgi:16S rRNA (uracil1498-N3)-methyltransferase
VGVPSERAAGLRDGKAHVFVDDLETLAIDDDDQHHLDRVLRLRPGDPVTASDGRGGWRWCAFGPTLQPTSDVVVWGAPDPAITVAFVPVKGERSEFVVQKLTELGVDRIVPFHSARSVVRWSDDRAERHHARQVAVAREAAMQCRRVWLPTIAPIADFATVAALPGAALADPDGAPLTLAHPTVLVGPEGGWADDEGAVGLPVVAAGPAILRAETAAIAVATLLAALRSGTVRPIDDHVG